MVSCGLFINNRNVNVFVLIGTQTKEGPLPRQVQFTRTFNLYDVGNECAQAYKELGNFNSSN